MGKSKRFKKGSLPRQPKAVDASVVHEVVLPAGGGGGSGPLPGVNETITKAIEAAKLNTVKPDGTVKPYANGGFVGGPGAMKPGEAWANMTEAIDTVPMNFSESISRAGRALHRMRSDVHHDLLARINENAARKFGDAVFEEETNAQHWADQARYRRSMRRENQLWRKTPEYKPCYAGRWRERQAGIVRTNRTFSTSMPISTQWVNPALASILFGDVPQRHVEGARVMTAPVGTSPQDLSAWKDVGTVSSVTVTNDSTGYSRTSTVDTSSSDCSAASVDCGGSF